jgi:hypothetical protein
MQPKPDWYLRFAWLLILICSILIASYFIINNVNSCTSQPLDYAVKAVKDKFEVVMVYGSLTLVGKNGASETISFGDIKLESTSKTYLNLSLP